MEDQIAFFSFSFDRRAEIGIPIFFQYIDAVESIHVRAPNRSTTTVVEEGFDISDNTVVENVQISIKGCTSDVLARKGFRASPSRVQNSYTRLKEARDLRERLTVVTLHDVFENMIITNLDVRYTVQTGNALLFDIELEELRTTTTTTTEFNPYFIVAGEQDERPEQDDLTGIGPNVNRGEIQPPAEMSGNEIGFNVVDFETNDLFNTNNLIITEIPIASTAEYYRRNMSVGERQLAAQTFNMRLEDINFKFDFNYSPRGVAGWRVTITDLDANRIICASRKIAVAVPLLAPISSYYNGLFNNLTPEERNSGLLFRNIMGDFAAIGPDGPLGPDAWSTTHRFVHYIQR